jgi:hypothetical protein
MTNLYQVEIKGKPVVYIVTGDTKEEAQIKAREKFREQFYISVASTKILSTEKF